jgi:hypothetical protein
MEGRMRSFFIYSKVLFLFIISIFLASCFHAIQVYEGPALPEEKVGIIYVHSQMVKLEVLEVDGKELNLKTGAWVDTKDCQIHLLPGEHTMLVTNRKGWKGRVGYGQALLKFLVEEGHTYYLSYDSEPSEEPGWLDIFPYIKDQKTKEIVSETEFDIETEKKHENFWNQP